MKILAINKRASFDYEILEKLEAGLVLKGYEVKSIKSGRVSLKGSYVTIKGGEAFLTNANIPAYQSVNMPKDYDPTRPRKILLRRSQIKSLIGKTGQKGLTLTPIKVYSKGSLVKIEIGLGKESKR